MRSPLALASTGDSGKLGKSQRKAEMDDTPGRFLKLRTRTWLVFVIGFSLFYFYSGGGASQASRFNLDRALLEHGRLTVDEYQRNTIDKAFFDGHYYSDKAPGASLAALPVLAVVHAALRLVGTDPAGSEGLRVQVPTATALIATLPALLLCLALFDWTVRRGYSPSASAFAALALGLASPLWAYATLFWGHALAAYCLFIGARAIATLTEGEKPADCVHTAAVGGFATAWAVVTEFPVAPVAFLFALRLLWTLRPWSRWARPLAAFAGAALGPALVLAVYNQAAFGSPFHLSYASVQGFEGMHKGFFGVTWPQKEALYGLLFSPRGLLFTAPLLLLGFAGHAVSFVRRVRRQDAILSLAVIAYFVLFNASYCYWNGSWSYGPRHLTAAFPFLAFGLAPLLDAARPRLRCLALPLLALGIFLTVLAVSTDVLPEEGCANPLREIFWPMFREGRFATNDASLDSGGPSSNFGLLLGLSPEWSLFPLLIGMLAGGFGLIMSLRGRAHSAGQSSAGDER
jgi:hypothetical protein